MASVPDLTFSEEQEALRDSVRRFLAETSPESEVRRLMETTEGYDPGVWKRMTAELGLTGLAVPEQYGGAGYGWREVAVVMEEMGRALACAPYLSAALATAALLAAGGDAAAQHLPGIAAGETLATLAFGDGVRASGGTLDGVQELVLDGHVAGLLLVEASDGLYAVRGDAGGLTCTPLKTLDRTRKLARVELSGVAAERVSGAEAVQHALQVGAVLLGAEQTGAAQRTMEIAADYARTRMQFGRPIGQFQGVKHRCADMLLRVESARAAAYYGSWVAAEARDDLPAVAHLVRVVCSEAAMRCAADNIQIHGGIGFTWEHPAHLYYRRAKSSELLLGTPGEHRAQLAQAIGVAGAPRIG